MSKSCFCFYFSPKLATPSPFFATLPQAPFLRHQSSAAFRLSPVFVSLERAKRPTVIHFLCSWPFLVSIFSCPQQLNRWPCRGHDNIHDDMIMYVIHTWSILIIVMNRWEIMHIWMIKHLFIAMIIFDHVWICWSLHHIVTPTDIRGFNTWRSLALCWRRPQELIMMVTVKMRIERLSDIGGFNIWRSLALCWKRPQELIIKIC